MPKLGFTIFHLALLFPWVSGARGSSYFKPPRASAPLSVGPTRQPPLATRGNSGLAYRKFRQSECALRKRYVQLLSGFVSTFGWLCWSCFSIVEMSCNLDAESDRNVLGEEISFVDRESLSWAKLGLPCRDLNFRKSCPRLWADGNLLMSGCR